MAQHGKKRYCPSCGTLVAEDATNCMHCGMRLDANIHEQTEETTESGRDALNVTQKLNALPDEHTVLGVDSALPAKEEFIKSHERESNIHPKRIIVSICACILIVCTAILIIFHPWDPFAYQSRTRTPADTSQEGFPGSIESLNGQDSSDSSDAPTTNSDEADKAASQGEATNAEVYTTLTTIYRRLGEISSKLSDSSASLSAALTQDSAARKSGFDAIGTLVGNAQALRSDCAGLTNVSARFYDAAHACMQCCEDLCAWAQTLYQAWDWAQGSSDIASDRSSIQSFIASEVDPAHTTFQNVYESITIPTP